MCDAMNFPDTVDEFMETYKIVDSEQVYTNGAELVPIFRMKQWFEHIQPTADVVPVRKGKWVTDVAFYDEEGCPCIVTRCDQCGEVAKMTAYCPHCGASMTEGAEDDLLEG